jgi:hypothetical protein
MPEISELRVRPETPGPLVKLPAVGRSEGTLACGIETKLGSSCQNEEGPKLRLSKKNSDIQLIEHRANDLPD